MRNEQWFPHPPYRRASKKRVRQGDIAYGEFCQLRAPTGDRLGPGDQRFTAPNLPFLGEPTDFEVMVQVHEKSEPRLIRLWQGFVLVIHQNCEIDFGNENDSRLLVAPIVSRELWPEGRWELLRGNRLPGYFYLPEIRSEEATELGLPVEWPESVTVLASATPSSIGLVQRRREMTLSQGMLPHLQDSLARFFVTRGFAGVAELEGVVGKRIVRTVETNQMIAGPSRLMKVVLGETMVEPDEQDDEITVSYWGVRPRGSSS